MGELHANIKVTLDGVMQANGGPTEADGDFRFAGWETAYGDAESGRVIVDDILSADALLLGRVTYDIWSAYWPTQSNVIADAFNGMPKYAVSRLGLPRPWDGTTHLTDAAAQVAEVRDRHRLVHTWGSADLLRTLLAEGLVDQVNLWTMPVVLGEGKRLLTEGVAPTRFAPVEPARTFPAGSTLLRLRRLDGPPPTVGSAA